MKIFISLLFIIISLPASAKIVDAQQWLVINVQGLISEKKSIGLQAEGQIRYSDNQNAVYESILRPAIYYQTLDYGSFFIGTMKRFDQDGQSAENRNWIQWLYRNQSADLQSTYRFRLEQRDLIGISNNSYRARLLYRMLSTDLLFNKFNPFVGVELFYNLNRVSDNLKTGINQSRTAIGFLIPLRTGINLEISYLNVYNFNRKDEDLLKHVLNTSLALSL